jgi:hypothetical protein
MVKSLKKVRVVPVPVKESKDEIKESGSAK